MLSKKIEDIKSLIEQKHAPFADDLAQIEADYERMAEFYAMGNIDPELDNIYSKLDRRAEKLLHRVMSYVYTLENPFYKKMLADTKGNYTLDLQELRTRLEDFVIDLTMLDLEADETQKANKRKEIFSKHHDYRKQMFAQIFLAPDLDEDDAEVIENILLSSSIDSTDAQLIITALMLSCANILDGKKADILYNVYEKAENELLRQKAIVSYVLCVCNKSSKYDLKKHPIKPQLLAAIQQQLLYTLDSPRVEEIMQKDIMPDIIKNSEFDFQNNRIIQKHKDKLDDILNPHKEEEMIDKMEETMKKMKQLQEQGSDLFFGGFRYVKRHPFFSDVINWFCPFYFDHPGLPTFNNADDKAITSQIIARTPFCDSDKYSFVISMHQAIGTIPQEMKQMIKNGEAQLDIVGGGSVNMNEAFMRRTYLQDLFRFYKICPWANGVYNMIEQRDGMLIDGFLKTADQEYDETAISTLKTLRKFDKQRLTKTILSLWKPNTKEGNIFKAFNLIGTEENHIAIKIFEEVLKEDEQDMKALFGITKAYFEEMTKKSVEFNSQQSTVNSQQSIVNSHLALYFKNENDLSVLHNLIKAYLLAGENDKALKYSLELIEKKKAEPFIQVFVGINSLAETNVKQAITLFKQSGAKTEEIFNRAKAYGMPIPKSRQDLIRKIMK
ncbi:MAG: hypothetical protein HUK07_05290 [Bacteroidaceae bacterium]|nr:hypothetical protein [Bacteroidaceae bacterium]